tara:strand:+ start:1712 stop:2482 length:771 start_codon:yes stop_codon:yes gene_type:complete
MKTKLEDLIKTLKSLRNPEGCDWNRAQTHETLIPYLLEETYEVIEAIENKDFELLKEELGDLLLHVIFQAELADEKKQFNIYDSIFNINQKLIKRKPHIFSNPDNDKWKRGNWELSKKIEKKRQSVLEGVPIALPSLTKAKRIQEKAAGVGFDWNNLDNVFEKIYEELDELKEAIQSKQKSKIQDELGDVLFSIVNLSRHVECDPELSLGQSTKKFIHRFQSLEKYIASKRLNFNDYNLSELDVLWNKIKEKLSSN